MDLHIHTNRYSGCSNIDAAKLLKRSRDAGLDGIALTEHGIRWSDEDVDRLIGAGRVSDLLVFPGQEVACYSPRGRFQGEYLVFGYARSLGSRYALEQILERVHGEGGVVLAAHPFKKLQHHDGYYGAGESVYDFALDGLEVEHPSYDDESRLLSRKAMHALKIAGIGCSDAHDIGSVGKCRSLFSGEVNDVEGLCREIRAGRVEAVNRAKTKKVRR